MTSPATIRILSERVISTPARPGRDTRRAAITYQLPPRPPNVIFIPEEDLPDLVWLRDNPDQTDAPEEIRAAGDQIRKDRIFAQDRRQGARGGRTI